MWQCVCDEPVVNYREKLKYNLSQQQKIMAMMSILYECNKLNKSHQNVCDFATYPNSGSE